MNWKEIKEQNPKCWEVLINHYGAKTIEFDETGLYLVYDYDMTEADLNTRDLYSFFDEQGIYCCLSPNQLPKMNGLQFLGFEPCIHFELKNYRIGVRSPNRIKMEEFLFSKAFKILEQKLTSLE